MIITVFTVNRKLLHRKYIQIEIQENTLGILYYSDFFKLVLKRGRPRQIWHERFLEDIEKYKISIGTKLFSRLWIEEKEFKRIVEREKSFLFCDFGYNIKIPNATTRRAIRELEAGGGHRSNSVAEMMAELNSED